MTINPLHFRMGAEEKVLAYLETMFHENAKDTDNINYEEFKTVVRCKQVLSCT